MSEALEQRPQRTPEQQLLADVRSEAFQQQVALALPSSVPASRFVRATVTALMQNRDLINADRGSLIQSVIRAAQDGLLPDGREAALVMYGQKVEYLPMIGGLRKIAAESGWTIRTDVVYENDEFDHVLGVTPTIHHKPVRPGVERGRPIAAYAVGVKPGRGGELHDHQIEVMSVEEIEEVRAVSKAKNAGPWRDWWDRMAEKTVGRRLFKKLPLGERDQERVRRILTADDLPPGEAAAALYGPSTQALEAGPEAGSTSPRSAEAQEPTPVEGPVTDSSTAEAEPETPAPASAASEFSGEEPPPPAEADNADVVAIAGEVEFTSGRHEGSTIAQVYERAPNYIVWAAANWADGKIKAAAITYGAAHGIVS